MVEKSQTKETIWGKLATEFQFVSTITDTARELNDPQLAIAAKNRLLFNSQWAVANEVKLSGGWPVVAETLFKLGVLTAEEKTAAGF